MNGIFDIASRIATPLALAGFFGAVLFFTIRRILQARFITTVRRPDSARILLRIINSLVVLCLVGMILGFAGYVLRLRIWDLEAPQQAAVEKIVITASLSTFDYAPEIRQHVSVGGHGLLGDSDLFVSAFWDIVITNNSDRDISIVSYSIEPLTPDDMPGTGPYGESYSQGLFEFTTVKPLDLPFSITAGHALHFKARSWIVILPSRMPSEVTEHWGEGPPSGISMWDLFYNYFASHGVDFFGNKVAPGPRGISPDQERGIQNQELALHIHTGRGNTQVVTLKWY